MSTREESAPGSELALATPSCLMGPDYQRPVVPTPRQYRDAPPSQEEATLADLPWWNVFKDPELLSLIGEAVQNNRDLRTAVARVEQARALARIQKAQILPAIGANAAAGYGRGNVALPTENPTSAALFSIDAQVSWEIDVWGRIPPGDRGRRRGVLRQRAGTAGGDGQPGGGRGRAYMQLRQLDAQLDVAQRTVKNYQRTLQLYSDRLSGGTGNKLQVSTGKAQVNDAQAVALDTERLIVRQENLLSLLLGRVPGPVGRSKVPRACTPPVRAGRPARRR